MPDPASQPPSVVAAAPERAGVWEDFIDIFYAPSAVFARRAGGSVWPPLLVVTLAVGALVYLNSGVLQPVMDAEFDRAMAQVMRSNPRFTPEMADRFRPMFERFGQLAGFVFVPLSIVATGTVLWLAGKLFEARQTYRAAMVVAGYAFVPRILEAVLNGVQGLVLDPAALNGRWRLTFGVGRFLDPDTTAPLVLALLGRLDVFTIWVTLLLAIGLAVTGGIGRTRAFGAAALVWAAGALPGVMQALRGAAGPR